MTVMSKTNFDPEKNLSMIRAIYTEEGYTGGCYVNPGDENPVPWMTPSQLFDLAVKIRAIDVKFMNRVPAEFLIFGPNTSCPPTVITGDFRKTVDGESVIFPVRGRGGTVTIPGRKSSAIDIDEDLLLKHAHYVTMRNEVDDREVWKIAGKFVPSELSPGDIDDAPEFMEIQFWFEKKRKDVVARFLVGFGGDLISGLHDAMPGR